MGMTRINARLIARLIVILHCSILDSVGVEVIMIMPQNMEEKARSNAERLVERLQISCMKMRNSFGKMWILKPVVDVDEVDSILNQDEV